MSLEAGALKVEGPIAQKGSIALEVTWWQRSEHQPPGTFTLKEFSGILTTTHTYPSGDGRSGNKTNRCHRLWIALVCKDQQSKAKQSSAKYAINLYAYYRNKTMLSAPADQAVNLNKPACLELNCWPGSIVSRLTLPELEFSHSKIMINGVKPSHVEEVKLSV